MRAGTSRGRPARSSSAMVSSRAAPTGAAPTADTPCATGAAPRTDARGAAIAIAEELADAAGIAADTDTAVELPAASPALTNGSSAAVTSAAEAGRSPGAFSSMAKRIRSTPRGSCARTSSGKRRRLGGAL